MAITHRAARAVLAATAATSATLALTATSAQAWTTYKPTGGPAVSFVNQGAIKIDFPLGGFTLDCTSFTLGGTVSSPGTSRAYAAPTGSTGPAAASMGTTSSGCSHPVWSSTVTPQGTWKLALTGDPVVVPSATGTTGLRAVAEYPAKIYDIRAYVDVAGCTFYVGGAADTATTTTGTGWVSGTFDPLTQVFKAKATSAGLVVATVPSGPMCTVLDYFYEDDPVAIIGATTGSAALWKNMPPAGSTSLLVGYP
ncbi:hypothetical protein GUY44_08570 [Pimelobacter simplex]|uniref:hypothetical protein n=1 Tax=Nocardioides simplex TaxID=2045 RepID=UPI000535ED82|nr:hypothetical protein [Pimelobacter simplex]MCG8150530.1 hypothetical protein [Pimelobacter simplex]GEB15051.1 hypothetical protein NSI01_33660 [Pimelobacter simplex]SFM87103.1 hypothetical protein SAMN05421671_3886 [Pimelobacter simplex]